MSESFNFVLRTSTPNTVIKETVENVWNGKGREVKVINDFEESNNLLVVLKYYLGANDEIVKIKKVVSKLFEISIDGVIYYIMNLDYYSKQISSDSITVEEIFSKYPPDSMEGPHMKYRIIKT